MKIVKGSIVQLKEDYGFFIKAGKSGVVLEILDSPQLSIAGKNLPKALEPQLKITNINTIIPLSAVRLLA